MNSIPLHYPNLSYATHYFYLGIVNGVNEGVMTIVATSIITGMFGSDFWLGEGSFGIQRNTLIAWGIILFGIFTCTMK